MATQMAMMLLAAFTLLQAAAAQRAPNGSIGTIDFRYPDDIVSPLVACPMEGVYPHPRDCRWYYREMCTKLKVPGTKLEQALHSIEPTNGNFSGLFYDRVPELRNLRDSCDCSFGDVRRTTCCHDAYGYGYFRRSYFECEPGTYFSDAMDQCLHQGDGQNCRYEDPLTTNCREEYINCQLQDICAPSSIGSSFIYKAEVCSSALTICLGSANERKCGPGFLYDKTNSKCIEDGAVCNIQSTPRPDVLDDTLTCEDEVSECFDYNVCRPSQQPEVQRLCKVTSYCYNNAGIDNRANKCPGNQVFDITNNRCTDLPLAQDTCPGGALGQAEVSCVRQSESCNVYESCETRETFLGCSSYFLCTGQPATPVCPAGFVFVARLNQCLSLYSSRDEIGQPAGGSYSPCVSIGVIRPPNPPVTTTAPDTETITPPTVTTSPTTELQPPTTEESTPETSTSVYDIPYNPAVHEYIESYQCTANMDVPIAIGHSSLGCKRFKRCNANGEEVFNIICQKFFVCVTVPVRTDPLPSYLLDIMGCSEGQFFDYSSKFCRNEASLYTETWRQCVGDATGPSTTPTPTPTTGPTIAPGDATSSPDIIVASTQITINSDINCNGLRLNDIPDMDQTARDRVCKNVALCNEQGQWQGQEYRCGKYYKCLLDNMDRLAPQEVVCDDPNQLFFPEFKRCMVPESRACGNSFYYWVTQRNAFEIYNNTPKVVEHLADLDQTMRKDWLRPASQKANVRPGTYQQVNALPNYIPSALKQPYNSVNQQVFNPKNQQLANTFNQQPFSALNQQHVSSFNQKSLKNVNQRPFVGQIQRPFSTQRNPQPFSSNSQFFQQTASAPTRQNFIEPLRQNFQQPQSSKTGQSPSFSQQFSNTGNSNLGQPGFSNPQFRQQTVDGSSMFGVQSLAERGGVNEKILVEHGFENQQSLGNRGSLGPQILQQQVSPQNTGSGYRTQHHSNPGIPVPQEVGMYPHFSSVQVSHSPNAVDQPQRPNLFLGQGLK